MTKFIKLEYNIKYFEFTIVLYFGKILKEGEAGIKKTPIEAFLWVIVFVFLCV